MGEATTIDYDMIDLNKTKILMDTKLNLANLSDLSVLHPQVLDALNAYLDQAVSRFGERIISITLYGSRARGDADPDSDIDLFIIIRQDTPALRQALADIAWQVQFEHNLVISDIIRSANQLQSKISRFPYYKSVQQEGIVLWKNPSETTPEYA